ncbi:flagellar motor switch protein FliN [Sinorhizobium sp. BG8]|uniref:flagellar motor switch protein FliN n=1 Tax=Sinorhizobium sp. BG8 TaxID=2613773 RepID=UPI00193E77C1|nr:flagellar motor switch protein FliN [Sinorhizobium sp. BG8]QRM54221.1 flagellar motor switch protein FliN [Sinorhizobium sp. BG8]
MAPKKAPIADDLKSSINADDQELEQAIDDLRGVLKQGAEPAAATSFDADFGAGASDDPLAAFGGDFGSTDTAGDFGSSFGEAGGDFGGSDFGGGDFAGSGSAEPARPGSALSANLDMIMDIPIDLQIVLGSSQMLVSGLMNLSEGATIALDRRIGEPVEVMVNGRIIGRGEITVLENDDTRFGVKLIEVKNTRKS